MQYCSLQHWTLLPLLVTSTIGCCFCLGSFSSFFLELFLHWFPEAYWAPTDLGFPGGSDGKASACNVGDPGSIPRSGRSPGEGNGIPLQHSCLENPMDGGAWQATVYGVAKSWTWLSDFTSQTWGVHLSVSYLFAFSYCSWGSQGKTTKVVCNSLL